MISNNNIKNILNTLFTKSKTEHDKDISNLNTNMNKGWISSGTIADIQGTDTTNDTPVGSIIAHMGNTAPLHYLICDGTEYNIEDYTELSNYFLEQFGSINYFGGDGTTTFAVPDLRGEFLRGTGTNSHSDSGSGTTVGTHQGATVHTNVDVHRESSYDYISVDQGLPNTAPVNNSADTILNGTGLGRTWYQFSASNRNTNYLTGFYTSRPTNTSVLYCIKYESTKLLGINLYDSTHYSEDEEIIGQWIDGKPLYRKLFKLDSSLLVSKNSWTLTNISISSSNIESIVNCKSWYVSDDKYITMYTLFASCDSSAFEYIALQTSRNESNDTINAFILEYTKTTDTAFSVDEDIAWTALDSEVTDVLNAIGE